VEIRGDRTASVPIHRISGLNEAARAMLRLFSDWRFQIDRRRQTTGVGRGKKSHILIPFHPGLRIVMMKAGNRDGYKMSDPTRSGHKHLNPFMP
jgi:hypothetical protein